MTGDSFFALMCAGLIAMLFGLAVCFVGYRFFIILLPIWGFFFGLVFGAQTMQALFGTGAFATVTSWVVGFFVGGVFAVLSYLFYAVAIAVIAGSFGYAIGSGLVLAITPNLNLTAWVVGIAVAIALIFVTFRFNLQRWVVIIATSVLGAATIAGTIGLMFSPAARMVENPIQAVLKTSPLLAILGVVLAVAGIVVQARTSRFEIESYNRWEQPA